MQKLTARHLQLGDVVRYYGQENVSPFNHCTVERITRNSVELVRPFVHTSDVTYAGPSIITYIGLEHISIPLDSEGLTFELLRRDTRFNGTSDICQKVGK